MIQDVFRGLLRLGHHKPRVRATGHEFTMVESRLAGGVVRFGLTGDIDLAVRDRLRNALLAAIEADRTTDLLIDLGGARFLDCSGIGALVAGRNAATRAGCRYRVSNPKGIVKFVLDLTGMSAFLGGEDHVGLPVAEPL